MESLAKPTLVLMGGRMLSFAGTFFIPVVLVRIFTPEEFGTYKQVFLVYMTLYGIAQMGMAESLFYFLPRAPQLGGRYVLNSLLMLLAAAAICLGLLVKGRSTISEFLSNSGLAPYLPFLGLYLLFMTASAMLEIVMISRKQYSRAALSYALSDLLRAVLLILPVLFLRDLQGLLLSAVAFSLFRFAVTVFYVKREFGQEFRADARLLRQQLGYALPFELAVVVETLQINFHQYAVSHYFDAATFAIYSIGCLQIPLVEFLASPAGNVMMVRMSEEMRDGRSGSAIVLWNETTRKLALVFFPLFGLLLVSARDLIVLLFTAKYAASVPIFMIWSATILLSTLQTDSALRVYAQTRFLFALNVLRLVVIAGLIYVCLSVFGLLGGVLITLLASCIAKGLSLVRLKRLMNVRTAALLPWRSLASVGAAAGAALLIAMAGQSVLELSAVPRLLLVGLVYLSTFVILLVRFGLLSSSEKLALASWCRRLFTDGDAEGDRKQLKEEEQCAALSGY